MMWPPFQSLIDSLLIRAKADGLEVAVFMGTRTIEQQDALYALGRTVKNLDGFSESKPMGNTVTKAKGGQSWHNYGVAADVVFKPSGKWSWDSKLNWKRLGEIGKECHLEWGGDFLGLADYPHFQLTHGLYIMEAQAIYQEGGLDAVWGKIAALGRNS